MQGLNDLRFFAEVVEVVERSGFAAAARKLGMPRSRLSRRIGLLEERLGVRLVHRSTRRFVVTEGRLLGSPIGGATVVPDNGFQGRVWGPEFEARFDEPDAPSLAAQIARLMPGPGECRTDVADIYQHTFSRLTELLSGTEAERMVSVGEPWFACDDERQAFAYASLITSSPASAVALIAACRVEAVELLSGWKHVLLALATELRIKRTLDSAAIDRCIERAVEMKLMEDEQRRRRNWQRAIESARGFAAIAQPISRP